MGEEKRCDAMKVLEGFVLFGRSVRSLYVPSGSMGLM
jgi:hypothetical protein